MISILFLISVIIFIVLIVVKKILKVNILDIINLINSNKNRYEFLLITGLIIFSLLTIGVFGVGKLRLTSTTFNLIFSPSDLYKPLVKVDFSLDKLNTYEFDFKTKYPGSHALSVLSKKIPGITSTKEVNFVISISISDFEGKQLLSQNIESNVSSFWKSQKENGFTLLYFSVPHNIPLNKTLKVRLEVIKTDSSFQSEYNPYKLSIQKKSDE